MQDTSIYAFENYKVFLRAALGKTQGGGPSMAALARKTGYQRSFFSRVLNGELQLTPEGVFKVAKALGLTEEEQGYFFWLVEKERASDPDYRAHAKAKATHLRRVHEESQKAADTPVRTEEGYFSSYLSSWDWAAVHLATAIEDLQSAEKISARLGIPAEQVHGILKALVGFGLVEKKENRFQFAKGSVHIPEDSPWVYFHHSNWRDKALIDARGRKREAIHFTNLLTVTPHDRDLIRTILLDTIGKVMKVAKPSDARDLVCLNLDFFRV